MLRRSECPAMTYAAPASRSMAAETSPVNAPDFWSPQFCAPTPTLRGARAVEIGVRQDDRELVAAEAREYVGRTERLAHRAAELGQDDVADGVSVAVVDLLEVV